LILIGVVVFDAFEVFIVVFSDLTHVKTVHIISDFQSYLFGNPKLEMSLSNNRIWILVQLK
jgi:hypothetical protein